MSRAAFFRVLAVVNLIGAPGCDNVAWGGFDVRLERPISASDTLSADSLSAEEEAPVPLPEGPVLHLVRGSEGTFRLFPLFELSGDSLLPLPSEESAPGFVTHYAEQRLAPGREFVLFGGGTRVGSLTVTASTVPNVDFCYVRPQAEGVVELVPGVPAGIDLLALPRDVGRDFAHGQYAALGTDRAQRTLSLNLAGQAISEVGARWPPTVLETRQALLSFPLTGSDRPAFAATFVYRDVMRVGDAPDQAYSIFILGTGDATGYSSAYTWYRPYGAQGKAAPIFVTAFDWDRDAWEEILLEVYGRDTRWFMVLDAQNGAWRATYQDPCGEPSPADTTSGG